MFIYVLWYTRWLVNVFPRIFFQTLPDPRVGMGLRPWHLQLMSKKMGPYKMVSWLWVVHWEPLVVWWCLMHFVRVGSIKDKAMVSRLIILQMLVLLGNQSLWLFEWIFFTRSNGYYVLPVLSYSYIFRGYKMVQTKYGPVWLLCGEGLAQRTAKAWRLWKIELASGFPNNSNRVGPCCAL